MRAFVRNLQFPPLVAGGILALSFCAAFWLFLSLETPVARAEPSAVQSVDPEPPPPSSEYVEVEKGCGPYYEGALCIVARAGPGEEYPVVSSLRRGVVLKVEGAVLGDLELWYKVSFDEPIRYPERVTWKQFVAAHDVRHFFDDGVLELDDVSTSTKRIVVDRSEQKLYAYDGEELFMEAIISTGIQLTPTPRGVFHVYKKTPTRYMQGPLPSISEKYYDLPGVPWNLYFTKEGGVIHGAYWHDKFGQRWSNGCVNVPLAEARNLYEWAEIGTRALVRD